MRMQAFKSKASGESFTLSMSHFKASTSDDPTYDINQREGNSIALLKGLDQAILDPDILLMGDLNAVMGELCLNNLEHAGYEEQLLKLRSKDPNTQVGACIVNEKKRIVGIGYNGFPYGCGDDEFPWERNAEGFLNNKYPYVVHAEANAILNSTSPLDGCSIYVSLFPCNECAKLIIQSGIKRIVYMDDKYDGTEPNVASKRMLKAAGVEYVMMPRVSVKLEKE